MAAIVGVTLAAIGIGGSALGEVLPTRVLMLLAAGALLAHARPELRVAIACGVGLLALAMVNPAFSVYFVLLVGSLTVARRHTVVFLVVLVSAAILAPKTAFLLHYHQPGYWNWINEPSLTVALLVSALWLRTRVRPGPGAATPHDDGLSFALCYLFPSHATNPMPYSPALLSRARQFDAPAILTLLAWFVAKAAALVALRRFGQPSFLARLGPGDLDTLARSELWGMVILSYVETCLSLAATADIPVLIGRLFGFPLPDPFRLPLLAGNPVELWRRWGIYNRHVLAAAGLPAAGGRPTPEVFERDADVPGQRPAAAQRLVRFEVLARGHRRMAGPEHLLPAARPGRLRLPGGLGLERQGRPPPPRPPPLAGLAPRHRRDAGLERPGPRHDPRARTSRSATGPAWWPGVWA